MQRIPIKQPASGKGRTRLANNLLNSRNAKIIQDMLLEQQKHIKNYNGEGKKALDKVNSAILTNFYQILANTNCKENLIKRHNENYKYDKDLLDICASQEGIVNSGETLKDDKSKDIVSDDFRKCTRAYEDEKMQKVAFWANRIAHGCTDEISTFTEQYLGSAQNDYEANKNRKNFLNRVVDANDKFNNKPEFRFDQSKLVLLLADKEFDFDSCTDPNFVKAKDLMQEARIPCRDKEGMKNFIYCNKLQTMTNTFYALKDNAVENLLLHLSDPEIDDDDKHIEAFRIKDNGMKGRKGEELSRIVLANKSMYDIYLKNNDSVCFTDKQIDSFTDSGYLASNKKYKARSDLQAAFGDRHVNPNTMNALMEKCSVSVFHVPDKGLDKFLAQEGIVLNDTYPPVIESMAYNGGGIYDITPNQKKEKGLEKYLKSQELLNEKNDKKYAGNFEKMYSDKKITTKAKPIIEAIELGENKRR